MKAKVKKGWLIVSVGSEEKGVFQRFIIPISYLQHPLLKRLLEEAHEVYDFHVSAIRIRLVEGVASGSKDSLITRVQISHLQTLSTSLLFSSPAFTVLILDGTMKMKVKKGCLVVSVGLEEEGGGFQRFVIPVSCLYHPLFKRLLEKAYEVYDYNISGPLRLPCSVDDFLHLQRRINKNIDNYHLHFYNQRFLQ